jgi:hypothetical protein
MEHERRDSGIDSQKGKRETKTAALLVLVSSVAQILRRTWRAAKSAARILWIVRLGERAAAGIESGARLRCSP